MSVTHHFGGCISTFAQYNPWDKGGSIYLVNYLVVTGATSNQQITLIMGGSLRKSFEENWRKNQEFITEMNKVTLERQIHEQNQIRERLMAMQLARAREILYWFGSFYVIASAGMLAGFKRTLKPGVLAPILPLTFVLAYQADMAYGNKLHRIRLEAENIMQFENDLLELPCGLPTASSVDQSRLENSEQKLLHPVLPPL